jgi:glycyl-tRNA synthetase
MMFRVGIGPMQEEAYLRPETCQSIFVDFPLLFKTQRVKLPVGVAQVGRSFRNEIAPRQGLIRLRELNQAEVEVFFNPKRTDADRFGQVQGDELMLLSPDGSSASVTVSEAIEKGLVPNRLIGYYLALLIRFYGAAGLPTKKLRLRILPQEDRAFYSKAAYDLEVDLSVGWLELVACNYRSDYDLGRHSSMSGTDFTVDDGNEKVLPHVFELSMGIDRSIYALLETSLRSDGERHLLALRPFMAPMKVAVLPLVNKDGLQETALEIFTELQQVLDVSYDESGSIGRRYARADEVGVPYCITIDYDTLKDKTVTLRNRDDRAQQRVSVSSLTERLTAATQYPRLSGKE